MAKNKKEETKQKLSGLDEAVKLIEQNYGRGSIMRMGDNPLSSIDVISTGSIELDKALGVGGLPRGRVVEVYGPESSGKTTLMLHVIAEAQKAGGKAVFIDAEHALDIQYAKDLGVDVDNLLLAQPFSGEEALDILETIIRSNDAAVVVVDSVAALTPRAEIDGVMGQSHMGLQARLMAQALRKITALVAKSNCLVIFSNQIRMKIGVIFGNPETTTGGNSLKFYASVRLDIRKRKVLKRGDEFFGQDVEIKVVKNKVAPPLKVAKTTIIYGKGFGRAGELLNYHIEKENIEKAGSWYNYKGQSIQGDDNMIKFIEENLEEFEIKRGKNE